VRGVVHDPQHRPVADAKIALKAQASAWTQQAESDSEGEFSISAVPAGAYTIEVALQGFRAITQPLDVAIGGAPILHFQLEIAGVSPSGRVIAPLETAATDPASAPATVGTQEITRTPGADRTNSLSFVTGFVPGSYMIHDQLHIRGGHQVSWLVDG